MHSTMTASSIGLTFNVDSEEAKASMKKNGPSTVR